jgi:plasmid stability protein
MSSLTIPDLDEPVARRLEARALSHGRSVESEAREILIQAVGGDFDVQSAKERMRQGLAAVRGRWKDQGSTDELMRDLRGED